MSTDIATVLADAALNGYPVLIERADRTLEGTLHPTGAPNEYRVRTGRRGRPAVVHADDVVSVSVSEVVVA